MKMRPGDHVGMIQKVTTPKDGKTSWRLIEDKITKVVVNKNSMRYYTSKHFYPQDVEDVDFNTEFMEENQNVILTREVFGLNDITRKRAEQWVEWANANPNKAVSILE